MGTRSTIGQNNPAGLVNRYIGTSYDTVKFVADNMSKINEVALAVEHLSVYLGVHEEIPLVRETGEPVEVGDYYYDTTLEAFGFIISVELDEEDDSIVISAECKYLDMTELTDYVDQAAQSATDAAASATQAQSSADAIQTNIDQEVERINDIQSTLGTSDGETDLGTFTGVTISDNTNLKSALQELETKVESINGGTIIIEANLDSDSDDNALAASQGKALRLDQESLDSRLTTAENDIASITPYDDTLLSNKVSENETDISNLEISVSNTENDITNIESNVTNLDNRVTSIENDGAGGLDPADKTKLDNIEDNATADQTGAEIKAAYEAENDTNAFTNAYKTKLDGLEPAAIDFENYNWDDSTQNNTLPTNLFDEAKVVTVRVVGDLYATRTLTIPMFSTFANGSKLIVQSDHATISFAFANGYQRIKGLGASVELKKYESIEFVMSGTDGDRGIVVDSKGDDADTTKGLNYFAIGHVVNYAGDNIPYAGEWIDHSTTTVLTEEDYPEFVLENRDDVEGANSNELLSYSMTSKYASMGTNIKLGDELDDYPYMNLFHSNIGVAGDMVLYPSLLSVYQTSNSPFSGISAFYNDPGVSSPGSLGSTSINTNSHVNSFSGDVVKNVTLFDGTVCEGFVCVTHSKVASLSSWSIKVDNLSNYNSNLGNYTNSLSNSGRTESNSVFDTTQGQKTITGVKYYDTFFTIQENNKCIKYSYDFSGGTLKKIGENANRNSTTYKTSRLCAYGNITNDFYELDEISGYLYINGVQTIKPAYLYNREIKECTDTSPVMIVLEYNDNVFVGVVADHAQNGATPITAYMIKENDEWISIQPPQIHEESIMLPLKIDLHTGLIIMAPANDVGVGISSAKIDDNLVNKQGFIVSTDFGRSYFNDVNGVLNSNTQSSYPTTTNQLTGMRHMSIIAGFESSTTYPTRSNRLSPSTLLKSSTYKPNDPKFSTVYNTSTDLTSEYIWTYSVELNTSTIRAITPLSNKIKTLIRVK